MKWLQAFLTTAVILGTSSLGTAATIHVPADSATIQAGINGANEGDTVLVAAGTYYETIDFMGKGIVVRSEDGAISTVIDGEPFPSVDAVVSFISGEGSTSILEGFTITKGAISGSSGISCENTSPVIRDNIIIRNGGGIILNSHYGGKCYARNSPTIIRNYVGNGGLGIWCNASSPLIKDNIIVQNSGGINISCWWTSSSPQIIDNVIGWNVDTYGEYYGILIQHDSTPLIEGNIIIGNRGLEGSEDWGGGIFHYDPEAFPTIRRNLIMRNGLEYGGGIFFQFAMNAVIENNTIVENIEGIYFEGTVIVDSIQIKNNVITDNVNNGIYALYNIEDADISYNDIYGNAEGQFGGTASPDIGNISAEPVFRLDDIFDYTLLPGSPCIDAGDPSTEVPPGGGDRVDMGAYEHSIPFNDIALTFDSVPDTVSKGGILEVEFSLTNPLLSPILIDVWFTASGWSGATTVAQFPDQTVSADTTVTRTLSFPVPVGIQSDQYNLHGKIGYIDEWIADAENAIVHVVD